MELWEEVPESINFTTLSWVVRSWRTTPFWSGAAWRGPGFPPAWRHSGSGMTRSPGGKERKGVGVGVRADARVAFRHRSSTLPVNHIKRCHASGVVVVLYNRATYTPHSHSFFSAQMPLVIPEPDCRQAGGHPGPLYASRFCLPPRTKPKRYPTMTLPESVTFLPWNCTKRSRRTSPFQPGLGWWGIEEWHFFAAEQREEIPENINFSTRSWVVRSWIMMPFCSGAALKGPGFSPAWRHSGSGMTR